MFHRLFSVYDSKVQAYLPLFTMRSKGEALRAFMDTCNDRNTGFAKHPEDYTLFFMGDFNDNDGTFNILEVPESVAKAHELVAQAQENNSYADSLSNEPRLFQGSDSGNSAV